MQCQACEPMNHHKLLGTKQNGLVHKVCDVVKLILTIKGYQTLRQYLSFLYMPSKLGEVLVTAPQRKFLRKMLSQEIKG